MTVTVEIQQQGLREALRRLEQTPEIIREAAVFAVERSSNPALGALRFIPRPSVHPFKWSDDPAANERGRRGYFARVARGEIRTDGNRYRRSGALADAWTSDVESSGTRLVARLRNPSPGARFVYGDANGRGQIPGHDRTGWPDFAPVAEVWVENTVNELEERVATLLERRR